MRDILRNAVNEQDVEVGGLGQFGAVPDESRNRFELWTTQPRRRVTSPPGWLNRASASLQVEWLAHHGSTPQSSHDHGGAEEEWPRLAFCGAGAFSFATAIL